MDQEILTAAEKSSVMNPITCSNAPCNETCNNSLCTLCVQCLSSTDIMEMYKALSEHQGKGSMKRLFPTNFNFYENKLEGLTENNRISVRWFNEKCKQDVSWC